MRRLLPGIVSALAIFGIVGCVSFHTPSPYAEAKTFPRCIPKHECEASASPGDPIEQPVTQAGVTVADPNVYFTVGETESTSDLTGTYHIGAGLGYFFLSIRRSGLFDYSWGGCEGLYGVASGVWSLEGDRLTLHAYVATTDPMTPN